MDLPHYTPPRGFWNVTTLGIVGSIVGVSLIGPRSSLEHIFGPYIAFALELAFVSGICVGLLQTSRMPQLSSPSKAPWLVTTVLGTTIGWVIVFAIVNLLVKLFPNLPIFSDQIVLALFNGLFIGGSMGAIVGLITGTIQARFYGLPASEWIIGNVISWSIGVAVPLAVSLVFVSQITLF